MTTSVYNMPRKNVIPVRLCDNLYQLIKEYALFMDITISEALREVIREGLLKKSYIGLIKRWENEAKKRDPFIEMKFCEKCNANNIHLKLYHIDGNVRNLMAENLVILCESCITKLQLYIRKYDPKRKFAAWFFYEN